MLNIIRWVVVVVERDWRCSEAVLRQRNGQGTAKIPQTTAVALTMIKKRRGNQSSIAKRYLAAIDPASNEASSPSSRRSKASLARTEPTCALDHSGSASWAETTPGRSALSASLELTTPGSAGKTPSAPLFPVFPATSLTQQMVVATSMEQSDQSSLSSRPTTEDDDQLATLLHHAAPISQSLGQSIDSLKFLFDAKTWTACDDRGYAPSDARMTALARTESDLRSDFTGASTHVATNRAVDVTLQRIRHLEKPFTGRCPPHVAPPPEPPQEIAQHPPRYSFGGPSNVSPRQLEARSLLSVSSNDSSSRTPSISHLVSATSRRGPPLHRVGRLGHFVQARSTSTLVPAASVQSQSLSSSVGVEVNADGKVAEQIGNAKSIFLAKRALTKPLRHGDDDLQRPMSRNSQSSKRKHGHFMPGLVGSEDDEDGVRKRPLETKIETKTFANRTLAVEPLSDDSCVSPPQIVRRATHQDSLDRSPDPIFGPDQSPASSAHRSSTMSGHFGSGSQSTEGLLSPEPQTSEDSGDLTDRATISVGEGGQRILAAKPKQIARFGSEGTDGDFRYSLVAPPRPSAGVRDKSPRPRVVDILQASSPDSLFSFKPSPSSSRNSVDAVLVPDSEASSEDKEESPKDTTERHPAVAKQPDYLRRSPDQSALDSDNILLPRLSQDFDEKVILARRDRPMPVVDHAPVKTSKTNMRSARVASSILATVSLFERSNSLQGGPEETKTAGERPKEHGKGLDAHMAQNGRNCAKFDMDHVSVSIQSIRSAFESVQASAGADDGGDDSDDDNMSVKEMRERLEAVHRKTEPEMSAVTRMRAVFEAKAPPRKGPAAGTFRDAMSKFDAKSSRPATVSPGRRQAMRPKASVMIIPNRRQLVASSIEAREVENRERANTVGSVADRIRAFGGSGARRYTPATSGSKRLDDHVPSHSIGDGQRDSVSLNPTSWHERARASRSPLTGSNWQERVGYERPRSTGPLMTRGRFQRSPFGDEKKTDTDMYVHADRPKAFVDRRPEPTAPVAKPVATKAVVETQSIKVATLPAPSQPSSERPITPTSRLRDRIMMFESRRSPPPILERPAVVPFLGSRNGGISATIPTEEETEVSPKSDPSAASPESPPRLGIVPPPQSHVSTPYHEETSEESQEEEQEQDHSSSSGDGSEFSDGVTLDVSIAEVSNLTNPTALVSRTGDNRSITTEGCESSDPSSRQSDLIENEAKRSEASSSQPSEAAVPLIAKAMRSLPMSDEMSANSFFATRAVIADHWSKTSGWESGARSLLGDRLSASDKESQPDGESSSVNRTTQPSDNDSAGWDINRVVSSFPVTESTAANDIFDFDSGWEPFGAPLVPTTMTRAPEKPAVPQQGTFAPRTKTPLGSNTRQSMATRSANISPTLVEKKELSLPPRSATLLPAAHSDTSRPPLAQPASPENALARAPPKPQLAQPASSTANTSGAFSRTHPRRPDPTWKRRASGGSETRRTVSSSAIERLPVRLPPSQSLQQYPPPLATSSSQSSGFGGRLQRYGEEQAALMARLKALKEARMRRVAATSRFANYHRRLDDEHSQSTKSSTQFGGSTFVESLEVD